MSVGFSTKGDTGPPGTKKKRRGRQPPSAISTIQQRQTISQASIRAKRARLDGLRLASRFLASTSEGGLLVRFIHKFSRSLSCKMLVSDTPPKKGQPHIQEVEWTGRPKPKHLREYIRFCHVVNSHLAAHWQISLLHVVQTSPTLWEAWEYPSRPSTETG
jgi:hypothetical protein